MLKTPTNQKIISMYYDSATKQSKRLRTPTEEPTGLTPTEKKMYSSMSHDSEQEGDLTLSLPPREAFLGPIMQAATSPQLQSSKNIAITKEKLANLNTEGKIDLILDNVMQIKIDFDNFKLNSTVANNRIENIEKENQRLQMKVSVLEGKNAYLEKELMNIKEKVDSIDSATVKSHIILHNIPESRGKEENVMELVKKTITEETEISLDRFFSSDNVQGDIRLDVAFRRGKKSIGKKPRQIIVKCMDLTSKNIVLSLSTKLREKESFLKITDQLPPVQREKRVALIPALLTMRQSNNYEKVSLSKDKLFADGQEINPGFEKNPLDKIVSSFDILHPSKFSVSATFEEKQSKFTAYSVPVQSKLEASAALNSLFQFHDFATATHKIYAYVTSSAVPHLLIRGHSDDGEFTAGKKLSDLLMETRQTNILVCVTRHYGNVNLGDRRFDIIVNQAKQVLPNAE